MVKNHHRQNLSSSLIIFCSETQQLNKKWLTIQWIIDVISIFAFIDIFPNLILYFSLWFAASRISILNTAFSIILLFDDLLCLYNVFYSYTFCHVLYYLDIWILLSLILKISAFNFTLNLYIWLTVL